METREDLALQHFIDSVRDPETQKALRLADLKDIASALVYAHKIEAAQQASRKDRHTIRGVSVSDPETDFSKLIQDLRREIRSLKERKNGGDKRIRCWNCSEDGHVRRNCPMLQDGVNNRRKPHLKIFQISSLSCGDNEFFVMGHVNKVPYRMVIDTGANVTIIRSD